LRAVELGQKRVVEMLLAKSGEDVNGANADGRTPLFVAVEKAFLTIVPLLLASVRPMRLQLYLCIRVMFAVW
jgi:ankyrin repeat protein